MERRIKRGWMNLRVIDIVQDTPDTKTLHLVDAAEGAVSFDYNAGQYLTLRFDNLLEKPIARSYTMSSSPLNQKYVALTVKALDNGVASGFLCGDVKVGDVLRGRGPIGAFCYHPETDKKNLVFVAAGSGVTPFLSMIENYQGHMGVGDAPTSIQLLVGYRSPSDFIGLPLLRPYLRDRNSEPSEPISVYVSYSRAKVDGAYEGRLGPEHFEHLARKLGSLQDKTFMTCGPKEMMDSFRAFLLARGVAENEIKFEDFF